MDAGAFKHSVEEHLVFTCAKTAPDASADDFYSAFAHAVRDRLVHRWIATQKTFQSQDVKQAY